VKLYQEAGEQGKAEACLRCAMPFASSLHVEDLKQVLGQLGFDYAMQDSGRHWVELCPACKRKALAAAQLRLKEESRG
jgi:hypothetical protein